MQRDICLCLTFVGEEGRCGSAMALWSCKLRPRLHLAYTLALPSTWYKSLALSRHMCSKQDEVLSLEWLALCGSHPNPFYCLLRTRFLASGGRVFVIVASTASPRP